MSENLTTRLWLMRLGFVFLCLLVLFWQLMPLDTLPRLWAGPDLLMVLCVLWVLRRPDYAPSFVIAPVMLLADFVLMRPPGLFALMTIIVCENLRKRAASAREMPFGVEWLTAAVAMAAIVLANRFFTAVFVLDQTSLGLSLMQLAMSVAAYPLVVFAMFLLFRLRHLSPQEADSLGGRT